MFGVSHSLKAFLLALLAGVAIQACGSATDASLQSDAPSFAFTLASAALSVTPGGTVSTEIDATRTGGLTSPIAYTITGAPAGLTAAVVATTIADHSTLEVTASLTLAPGTYSLVVNATAPGVPAQQATFSVVVGGPAANAPELQLVATGAHTCAITTTGAAYCWGYNGFGQLGNDDTTLVSPSPVAVAGGRSFQSIAVPRTGNFTCGLAMDGVAYCWGKNDGQLGDGTKTDRWVPTPVAGGLTFRSLAVGEQHVCAVTTDGKAYCWGSTSNGAFGDGTVGERLTPAVAAPGMTFVSIVAGADYTCGLTPAGSAFCWGRGNYGQLGNGDRKGSTTPVAVSGGLSFGSLAGGGLGVCGLTNAGKAYCWGRNEFGEVGDGTTTLRSAPVPVAGGRTFVRLSAGYETTCGVAPAGAAYCWGFNADGGVGDGTFHHRSSPVVVTGGLTFRNVSAGFISCGVTVGRAAYCWGDNSDGILGDGTTTTRSTPAPVRWP